MHFSMKELKPTLFLSSNSNFFFFLKNVSLTGNSEKFLLYRIYNLEILCNHQQTEGIF